MELFSHPSPMDTAYAAGLFDGEGNISLQHSRSGSSIGWSLHIRIGLTTPTVLSWLQQHWGGSVKPKLSSLRLGRLITTWSLRVNEAPRFLRDVEPYLKIKQRQATLALDYLAAKRHTCPLSPEELALRLGYELALKEAKTDGVV